MEFSAPYDRDLRDVLILQSEVAEAVARTIAVTLTPDAQARRARARPIHPEAYQDYLRGGGSCGTEGPRQPSSRAIGYFQKAIAADPGYAPAYSDLADSCENRQPQLWDLKETGSIEEDAHVVMFIHRPERYACNAVREDLRSVAEFIIAKQREGPTGVRQMVFRGAQQRFESRAENCE